MLGPPEVPRLGISFRNFSYGGFGHSFTHLANSCVPSSALLQELTGVAVAATKVFLVTSVASTVLSAEDLVGETSTL